MHLSGYESGHFLQGNSIVQSSQSKIVISTHTLILLSSMSWSISRPFISNCSNAWQATLMLQSSSNLQHNYITTEYLMDTYTGIVNKCAIYTIDNSQCADIKTSLLCWYIATRKVLGIIPVNWDVKQLQAVQTCMIQGEFGI